MFPSEEGMFEGEDQLRSSKTGPEDLTFELILIGSIAIVCVILFIIYIFLAKVEDVPKEYFMKNRIPLIRKVLQNKLDIKKAEKAKRDDDY